MSDRIKQLEDELARVRSERDLLAERVQEQKSFIDKDGNCENAQLILELVKERDRLREELDKVEALANALASLDKHYQENK